MTIKQHGGIFGRNPTFNEIGGTLTTAAQPNITSLGTQTSNLAFASGQGIDFSATGDGSGTSTSELLSDYEQGSWTPVPKDSSGNTGSASLVAGNYTKIGNFVFATVYLNDIDTTGLTNNDLRIYGLPYISASLTGGQIFTGAARTNDVTFSGNPNLAILDSTDYIRIVESISGTNSDFVTTGEINSGTGDIYGSITYIAA